MAHKITMPRLSDTMTEGTVAKWLKKVGDKIEEGDILAEIETDKATMEFEAFEAGTLLYIGLQDGDSAPVDSLLAIVGKEGEDYKSLLEEGNDSKEEDSKEDSKEESKSEDKKDQKSEDKSEDSKEDKPKEDSSKSKELPKGVVVVKMPRLSDTMTEGTVATWIKKVGDKIEEGDILAEIETDKATMEFESFNEGTLLYIGIKEGESAPIDSILAILGPEGTDVSGIADNFSSHEEDTSNDKKEKSEDSKEDKKEDRSESKETASTEEKSTSSSSSNDDKRVFISPLARKIAEEKGINLNDLKGSGENGRIIKSDIENYKPQEAKPAAQAAPAAAASGQTSAPAQAAAPARPFVAAEETDVQEVKNSQMRKTIARRLAESKFTAPHYYLTIEVVMDQAMASRKTINSLPDTKVSFNDLVIKACAMALKKHPRVNSTWKEDVTVINHHVHIGVAVAVEDGLLVPVLPFADQRTLTQIGAEVKNLASKAKNKKLQPSEMEGSTFTVSNLGMFGISEFTSIINQPNSAILSVGAIEEKPVVKDGQIVVGNTMKLTLACDHRTVDGATGAEFLQTLRQYLENPVTMLA
ncbi:pyruvate dehydrogenase complex dihydrolipoamide acetyltransferase [Flavobacterium ardleyense]|uniref:pyruvate dehydrogenase complex dihydrolipoamide acetyltransferase n=1 Tax=Flavobacterium ardleyense TaxID=2038737 RepID=UPI00298D15DF|nr:pyruvate dehydrogenase complex dihydrolipoamide acetyltransferase [Flavobacterium ardleyense]